MKLAILINALALVFAANLVASGYDLKNDGLYIEEINEYDEQKEHFISRNIDPACRKVDGADPHVVFSGDYVNEKVNKKCVKSFLTTAGWITPMQITPDIKTIGELELIDFIVDAQDDKNKLLIDARLEDWYNQMTIPTARNIPFNLFDPKKFPDDFYDVLESIGVEVLNEERGEYDFSQAKALTIFCNGAWCPQSGFAIRNLLKIGYPQDKIFWYRGGLQSWLMFNLTTYKP